MFFFVFFFNLFRVPIVNLYLRNRNYCKFKYSLQSTLKTKTNNLGGYKGDVLAAALATGRLSDTTTAFEDLKKQTTTSSTTTSNNNNKRKKSEEDDLGFGKKIADNLRENPVDWLEKNEKHKNLFRKNAVFERGFAR